MPPLPNVPSVLRLDLNWSIDEDLFAKSHTFWQYFGPPPTTAQVNTFLVAVEAAYNGNLRPEFHASRVLTKLIGTDLNSTMGAHAEFDVADAGGRVGTKLPASTAVVESFEIVRRYRGGHPRNYIPAGVEGDLFDSQTWTDAFVAEFQTAWQNFVNAVSNDGWNAPGTLNQVNVSYFTGNVVFIGPTGRARNISQKRVAPVIDAVTSHVTRKGIGSQRKRLLRLA